MLFNCFIKLFFSISFSKNLIINTEFTIQSNSSITDEISLEERKSNPNGQNSPSSNRSR